ncbi:MAG: NA+/H+ antiporter (napA), putative [uncultured Sulfurovum sp.]|uniref:NA+/H+ antiporter (NapA), putative n=1 Tax=uncultured Sulfurovum sp. TaxID=269237 RepID=A0A6S6SHA3_9BACT|nr:MAG: NA+/H+ antiporter (napA), putative [uncultured Sulfurovum sp.]
MNNEDIGAILAISLILVLSPHFSRLFRLPTAPIEIVLGSCLAFFGIINIANYNFFLIAHVGFLYLMFLAGLEVNLKSIFKMPKIYIIQSIYFLIIMWILAIIFGILTGLDTVLIIILPLISIGVLATLSKEYGKEQHWIKIAFLVGTLGEVLSIIVLTIFEAYSTVEHIEQLIEKLALLLMFLLGIWVLYIFFRTLFWWYPELKTTLMPSSKSLDGKYQDLRLAMGLFFIMISIMLKLHLEVAFGAFIAGVFIATFFHHKKALEERMSSFGFGFLVPIFFIYVGASLDLRNILFSDILIQTLILLSGMFGIRIIAAFTLSFIAEKRQALLIAFSLSMPLTLMIAVATIAKEHNGIGEFDYYAVILASLLEVIISMIVIKFLVK